MPASSSSTNAVIPISIHVCSKKGLLLVLLLLLLRLLRLLLKVGSHIALQYSAHELSAVKPSLPHAATGEASCQQDVL
jgi:hypothetical protein